VRKVSFKTGDVVRFETKGKPIGDPFARDPELLPRDPLDRCVTINRIRMGKLSDAVDRQAVERLWEYYDTYHHMGPEQAHLVRDEWVERFALAGTAEEVRRQVEKLLQFDIGELTIIPFGESKDVVLKMFAEAVIGK